MNRKLIGTYILGWENIRLYIRKEPGCGYWMSPDDKGTGYIEVGYQNNFGAFLGSLTHEVVKFSLRRMECSYWFANDASDDNGARLFVMDHRQMSEVTARVGKFIAECYDTLHKAWKTFN
jgi:hypothetical protein